MQELTLEGLWSLEFGMANQMRVIAAQRLAAGLSALPVDNFREHPAKQFTAGIATQAAGGRVIIAGTNSYYEYIAEYYTTVDGTLIIPIVGTLNRYGYYTWGYEDLTMLLAVADRMESVKRVLLKISSGGGAVDGLAAAADAIRAFSKPVLVWTNFCASAAYFLASQADEIWVEETPLPVMGSIGTLMIYVDQSLALEKAGYKVEIFRATESVDKARENGIEPLSDESRAYIQQCLDDCQKQFVGYVQRGRAGKLKSDDWRTAKMYGTKDAVNTTGLGDVKGTFQGALKRALQLG